MRRLSRAEGQASVMLRTGPEERCVDLGSFVPRASMIAYTAPPLSVTTLYGREHGARTYLQCGSERREE